MVESRAAWSVLLVVLLVLAGAEVGHALSFHDLPFATFWPPAGVLVYALEAIA